MSDIANRLGPDLFPPPSLVRQRLADNIVEANALRRLLRVSEAAAEARHRRQAQDQAKAQPITAGG